MANNHPNSPKQQPQPKPETPLSKERAEYLAEQYDYTPGQINVVRNAICVGATDAELEFFLATAKRVGLDPFARQIWFVKRRQKIEDAFGNESWIDVGKPETSIDGFRTIAERSGEYEGQAPIEWCGKDGRWLDVWLKDESPFAARARVYRKSFREPMIAIARFSEYCPLLKTGQPPAMWRKMPANQLGVRAEAQALRRAFPRDLSGLVTDGEAEANEINALAYSAPPKQLEQSKPSRAMEAAMTVPQEQDAEPVERATTLEPEAPTEQAAVSSAPMDELDAEILRLQNIVANAKSREDLQDVGRAITDAKKAREKTTDNAWANSVVQLVEPQLQKRWRELPKK